MDYNYEVNLLLKIVNIFTIVTSVIFFISLISYIIGILKPKGLIKLTDFAESINPNDTWYYGNIVDDLQHYFFWALIIINGSFILYSSTIFSVVWDWSILLKAIISAIYTYFIYKLLIPSFIFIILSKRKIYHMYMKRMVDLWIKNSNLTKIFEGKTNSVRNKLEKILETDDYVLAIGDQLIFIDEIGKNYGTSLNDNIDVIEYVKSFELLLDSIINNDNKNILDKKLLDKTVLNEKFNEELKFGFNNITNSNKEVANILKR